MKPLRILIAAALPLAACTLEDEGGRTPPPAAYVATAVGRLDSAEEARRLVAATDGIIEAVHVERGQHVRAGDVLMSIDCAPRFAEVSARRAEAERATASAALVREGARPEEIAAARANLAAAQTSARNQQQRLDQASRLIERGFVSRREFDARTNDRDAATASVAAAQARLEQLLNGARQAERTAADAATQVAVGEAEVARAMADRCKLRSPIAGQVLQILRREGEFSGGSQGTPLIVVADLATISVRAEIGERDAALVHAGQRADIWTDGGATRWRGHVTHLADLMGRRNARSLDPTDRFDRDVREVFISFDGPAPPPLVGLRVTVGLKS